MMKIKQRNIYKIDNIFLIVCEILIICDYIAGTFIQQNTQNIQRYMVLRKISKWRRREGEGRGRKRGRECVCVCVCVCVWMCVYVCVSK